MNLSDKLNPQLFRYPPSQKPELLNPLVLAYIGDAVYEMFIRQYVISMPSQRPNHLHRAATRYVSAKAQSKALQALMPLLTEEEAGIVKRGRNAKSGSTAKNADVLEYRHSTAFESLIGYLYYKQAYERLNYIMEASLAPEKLRLCRLRSPKRAQLRINPAIRTPAPEGYNPTSPEGRRQPEQIRKRRPMHTNFKQNHYRRHDHGRIHRR